jgi:hypothetical protein
VNEKDGNTASMLLVIEADPVHMHVRHVATVVIPPARRQSSNRSKAFD